METEDVQDSAPEEKQRAPALDPRIDALIEAWFRANFHDSIVSRDTATFNHVRGAVDALKKELAA
ncbi:hypothetical protein WJ32_08485 [Burkholderia ubonensis]|uniref:Uncharacterized protein n=1 Tax=Burkholderia ubonensis TaxID=101571 RepID=A0A103QVP7_9BURK|nr:hypothetical protein [Burkholderia ubonensis]AOJ62490.1 hypothetical protein WJ32_08485 [Burkholderia ubonensis]KVG56453.1 hypothetical protein WJ33_37150 [Burkholderia ubonensis]